MYVEPDTTAEGEGVEEEASTRMALVGAVTDAVMMTSRDAAEAMSASDAFSG